MSIETLQNRLAQADFEIGLVKMVDQAIAKNAFHFRARRFVQSLISQRQVILNQRSGHKNAYQMEKAISHLKINLDAAASKDTCMARYFLANEEEIRSIIPGSWPDKRFKDFALLREEARTINQRQLPLL